ncbi:MAG: hypothetical protein LAT67_04110 [Balneolales bacterium]|nr:hypothetical protein [Balneolales bacterium]
MEFSFIHRLGCWRLANVVKKGDWDIKLKRQRKPRIIKKLGSGVPNEKFLKQFSSFINNKHAINLPETSHSSLIKVEKIYNSIKADGFKTPESFFSKIEYFPISIGRNGEFIYMSGKHRFAAAKVLSSESDFKIPARVCLRHAKWQEYRDELYVRLKKGDISKEQIKEIGHPDLENLLDL